MRISQKARYGVKAMLDLALHAPRDRGARTSEIAGRTGVPEKFLEAVLRELREAGLITSKRGPDGGHWLARDPSRVTLGAILEAIDGPISVPEGTGRGRVSPEELCLRTFWGRVEGAVQEILGTTTLEDLRMQSSAPGALDYTI
jgi:Rrf2 family protein